MKTLDKLPDYKKIESKWQRYWRKNKTYKFNPRSKKPLFSVDTPPPYISGRLHMGHGGSYTMFETIARFKRMNGYNVFLPIGFDDNGLPTERYVEKKLGIKAKDMPRQKFIKIALRETKALEKSARESFDKFGHSYDWDLFYSTISPHAAKTAQKSFLDLYKKKRVYRSNEPGLFCTYCQTAISQADLEEEKRTTFLNFINFNLQNSGKIQIATTRPELLASCVAVFVHPSDKRYKKHIGKKAIIPIFNHKVPIKSDRTVDREFGSGAVMICTFGDKTDVEWWRKHKLPLRVSLKEDGTLNELAGKFQGKSLSVARNEILDNLSKTGQLKSRTKIKQTVSIHDRCENTPEFIPTLQWHLKLTDLKKPLLKKAREINWIPNRFYNNFKTWTEGIAWDWTLSRQRHIGIPIPVWYDKNGKEILPKQSELPIDPTRDKKSGLTGEKDVFDTWFTSSLTPELVLDWANNEKKFKRNSPMTIRPQGQDIIRTWAFYTILKSLIHHKNIPWKDIVINGHILDPRGKKMSKSKGNTIDPLEQVEKYNGDSFRYWTTTTIYHENAPYQEKEIIRGTKLMNKLWNTSRFTFMNINSAPKQKPILSIEDKWILSRLVTVRNKYINYFELYNIKQARHELENFFLHEFCDFYLEMIKHRIYGNDKKSKYAAQWTTYNTLYGIIQLFAPIFVHLTEELYQTLYKSGKKANSIHLTEFEQIGQKDSTAESLGNLAKNLISEIRQWKQKNKIKLSEPVDSIKIRHPSPARVQRVADVVCQTMKLGEIKLTKGDLNISG